MSVLLAKNMPDYGRDIVYGATVLVLLLLYGRADREEWAGRSDFAGARAGQAG